MAFRESTMSSPGASDSSGIVVEQAIALVEEPVERLAGGGVGEIEAPQRGGQSLDGRVDRCRRGS
jgi:hypothetical protein